jgi:aspartyl-tRNA(Asn)/glutamyl-tRNA(Gln) amidotransferase subunit B
MVGTDRSARDVVAELGLTALSSDADLRPLCERILAENPKNVAAYRAGKQALLGFFVGQAMKQSGGRANPERVNAILRELLGAAN